VPKVQVTFRIDANGILAVEAKDLGTGRSQTVNVTPTSGLTHGEIDKLVAEGEKFKETDQLRRDFAEMKNQAETLIYTTEQALEGYGDLLDAERLESVRSELYGLKNALQAGVDLAGLRDAYTRLENATFEIAEAMYGASDAT
jgi:molecular chaperone DnaK